MTAEAEIKLAIRKLKHYFYYEKSDLITRTEILSFEADQLNDILFLIKNPERVKPYLKQISINLYPKKVVPQAEALYQIEPNFFSNENLSTGSNIKDFLYMAYFPVELHVISVIWLMRYGNYLDSDLERNAFGNRLEDIQTVPPNRKIFKNYISQYEKWWDKAIKTCKEQLENERDVLMINFDIKSFYNNVDFNFETLEDFINLESEEDVVSITSDPVHIIIKSIHLEYLKIYKKVSGADTSRIVLPIGLLTSFVYANWYLKEIDKSILELDPVYYGRYVDDFIIIFQGKSLKDFYSVKEILTMKLDNIILEDPQLNGTYKFKNIPNLSLQTEKTYVYKFNHKYPPSLLDKFISDQKERASEFRYLSDEEDENFEDFDKLTFEQNFSFNEGNSARFKVLEENKFKNIRFFR